MPGALSDKPGTHAGAVSPSDSTIIVARALFVGGSGNVTVTTLDGEVATFTGVIGGTILPIQCVKVMAATTATNITAIW